MSLTFLGSLQGVVLKLIFRFVGHVHLPLCLVAGEVLNYFFLFVDVILMSKFHVVGVILPFSFLFVRVVPLLKVLVHQPLLRFVGDASLPFL